MYNLAQNQIAYYPFRSTNPLEDVSGNLGPLIASSTAPTISAGPWPASSAAQFTQSGSTCQRTSGASSGQYYTLPSLSFPSATLTVCLWYLPSNKFSSGRTRLFEFSTAPSSIVGEIAFYEAGAEGAPDDLAAYLQGQSSTSFSETIGPSMWNTSKWTHLCAAINDSHLTVYVDNNPTIFTLSAPVALVTRAVNQIARSNYGGDCFFTGSIAELRIFNRSLSAFEVSVLYSWRGDSASPNVAVPCATQCTAGYAQVCNADATLSCIPCAVGSFQTGKGIISCTLCEAGTFVSENGLSACSSCGAGTYQTGLGTSSCVQCDAGKYSTGVGQVQNTCIGSPDQCSFGYCGFGHACKENISCQVRLAIEY